MPEEAEGAEEEEELGYEKVLSVTSRRRVLEEVVKNGEITAYEIAKTLKLPDAAVARHFHILSGAGLIEGPFVDTSGGRLKKIYRPSPHAERVLKDFWAKEIEAAPESVKMQFIGKKEVVE
jgi:predicted ArsR family transcriptional regulator